jgi:NAD(P)-dependent dehydrogenase (short-subunit alcohol dehydrogenase family)
MRWRRHCDLLSQEQKGADEVVERITEMKRRAAAFQADIGNISDGQRFIEKAVASLGKVDILINNAGLEKRADFWDVTEADFDAVLNVNLKGIFCNASGSASPSPSKSPGKNHQYQFGP